MSAPVIAVRPSVLLVSVSVVARATRVSGPAGSVSVPPDPLMVGWENVPPVTVLPVKVRAAGREEVGLPPAPVPSETVISLAVPVSVLAALVDAAQALSESQHAPGEHRVVAPRSGQDAADPGRR